MHPCEEFLGPTGMAAVPAEARPEARSTVNAVNCILIMIAEKDKCKSWSAVVRMLLWSGQDLLGLRSYICSGLNLVESLPDHVPHKWHPVPSESPPSSRHKELRGLSDNTQPLKTQPVQKVCAFS